MIVQTILTMPNLPIKIRHVILGASAAKTPKSDLGAAITALKQQAALADPSLDKRTTQQKNREMTEMFQRVSSRKRTWCET